MDYIIYKTTGKIESVAQGPTKIDIVYFNKELLILKIHGSSGYVHRGIGVVYTPSHYSINKIKHITNNPTRIQISCLELQTIDIKKQSEYMASIIEMINRDYELKEEFISKEYREFYEHRKNDPNSLENIMRSQSVNITPDVPLNEIDTM